MGQNNESIFDKIQKSAGMDKNQIFNLADSVKDANFKDDTTVRQIVKQVALLAGKPVTREKEDQIVKAIITNNLPLDFASLNNLFKK